MQRSRSRAAPVELPGPVRRWLRARPADVVDIFVYVVVLNLAIEYVPSVISEGFTLSLLTAFLLKIVLELVVWLKQRILVRFRAGSSGRARLAIGLGFWVVAAGSKFVVLKLEDLLFGDAVSLGGFVSVTLLIVVLFGFQGRGQTAALRHTLGGDRSERARRRCILMIQSARRAVLNATSAVN